MSRSTRLLVVTLVLLFAAPTVVLGQNKAAAVPKLEVEVQLGPKAEAKPLPDLSKTQVTIPGNELLRLLGQDGKDDQARPPVDFVFSQAECNVAIADDRAVATASAEVNTLGKRWALVPLGPSALSIIAAKADGQPCSLVDRDGRLFALLTGEGKHKLEIIVQPKITESTQGRQFVLPLIPSPIVSVKVTLPSTALEVQSEGATVAQTVEKDGSTLLMATCRGGSGATITWRPRPQILRPARLYGESDTVVMVEDGLVRVKSRINAQILQATLREVRFQIDDKAAILSVTGRNVARWSEQRADAKTGGKLVTATFAQPVQGEQPLEIVSELEIPAEGEKLSVSVPTLQQAQRDQGYLAVANSGGMHIAVAAASVPRIGVSQLPEGVRSGVGGLLYAYRYSKPPASISLAVSQPKPQPAKRFATTNTLVSLQPGRLLCQAQVHYEILHAGVDRLRIGLPEDVEVLSVQGAFVQGHSIVTEEQGRILVIDPRDLLQGNCEATIQYVRRFKESDKTLALPLLTNPDAEIDRGSVGIEVRSNYEIVPNAEGFERIDVKELPGALWNLAGSPLLFGYKYASPPAAAMAVALTRHEDLSVLVAMSDYCEAATVITPDGKCVTKMMFVLRNNMKPFMALKLPQEAEMWSVLVDDRPITPARNGKGQVLVPLKKSDEVQDEDEESYRARREKRRKETGEEMAAQQRVERLREKKLSEESEAKDLKPYDVEIVFVGKKVNLTDHGTIKVALPQVDIPTGHMAWAVFLPKQLRMTDAMGSLQEVQNFTLPFRHFAVVEYLKRQAASAKQLAQAMDMAQKAAEQAKAELAQTAKAQGVLPVRIEIPITGELYKFEKFLVVDETPEMTLTYRKKAD